jgi:cell wall-associated NlpC family hydrolase
MYIKNKTAMVKHAIDILNTETKYNLNKPYRVGGYYNVKQDGKYVYDCSSFCSTLMNRTFGIDMILKDKDKVTLGSKSYYNVWTTSTYINEAKATDGIFKVIDKVTGYGQTIDKSKLQIGDFILGNAVNIRNGVNHIMFYTGDDYIIHARGAGVVRERLDTDYYTRLESKENLASGNYTQRFDKSIQILRYRDRELK